MVRDFSDEAKQKLINLINEINGEQFANWTDWLGDRWYDFTDFIGLLDIGDDVNSISSYHKKVLDKNNTTIEELNRIFDDVHNADASYAVRFCAAKGRIEGYTDVLRNMSAIISPSNGNFRPGAVSNALAAAIKNFEDSEEIYKKLSGDGITDKDLADSNIDNEKLLYILGKVSREISDLLPKLKCGEKFEIPIGPDMVFYYSVSGKVGDGDVTIETVIEDQKLSLDKISYDGKTGNIIEIGGSANTDGDVGISISGDHNSTSININGEDLTGEIEGSTTITIGNNTYTIKTKFSLDEISIEESVTTNIGDGSVTSTYGIKKTNDPMSPKWIPIPIEIEDPVFLDVPSFSAPDVDWVVVAEGTLIAVAVAGIILIPFTGGASAVLIAV